MIKCDWDGKDLTHKKHVAASREDIVYKHEPYPFVTFAHTDHEIIKIKVYETKQTLHFCDDGCMEVFFTHP